VGTSRCPDPEEDAVSVSAVTHLRHVDLAIPDLARQLDFYRHVWGLTRVAGDTGIAFLAAEGSPEQYVVRLRESRDKRLDLIAFGAGSTADVDSLAARLGGAGVRLISEPAKLETPGGGYGFRFFDVDGRTVEVSSDVAPRVHRRIEEREAIPVRLSHAVVNSADPPRTRRFYEEQLGLRLTDTLASRQLGDYMYFLRCNPVHHSFAIARGPHVSLNHASFELRGIDEYMRGTGRVLRAGAPKLWGPGRHLAGDNTFTYFLDPHGNTVEYTTELAVVDEDRWHPHIYDLDDPGTSDQWGTAGPRNEQLAAQTRNERDPGVFVAPPV
jgi:catechol 2,3-dioxygenase-like lactoylglutathione lyase family enzyme